MLADPEPEALLSSSLLPHTHNVFFRPGRHGVPSGLILRVPEIEVVMVNAHAHKVFGPGLFVDRDEMVRIELVGRPHPADFFVPDLGRMAESFEVALILRASFNVHVARVPVAVLSRRLRPPMRPDAELGVFEPFGDLIRLQPFKRTVEGSFLNFGQRVLAKCPGGRTERGRGYGPDCVASCNSHGFLSTQQILCVQRIFVKADVI